MNEDGFSLPELLVAVAIGSLVLLGIGAFYRSAVLFTSQSASQVTMQRQGSVILDEMTRQIRPATTINIFRNATCSAGTSATAYALQVTRAKVASDPVAYPDPATFCYRMDGSDFKEDRPDGSVLDLLSLQPSTTSLNITSLSAFDPTSLSCTTDCRGAVIYFQLQEPSAGMEFKTTLAKRN